MVLGTLDAASARTKKHPANPPASGRRRSAPARSGPTPADGPRRYADHHERLPPARHDRDKAQPKEPVQRADRPIKIPRGSSTYIPPPNPSPIP